jgi:LPXTG-motif cell wall-anchored protein
MFKGKAINRLGSALGVAGLTISLVGVSARPASADGTNRITIASNEFQPAGQAGTANLNVNTQFTPLNGAPLTGNLQVTVELYSGTNVATYWNEAQGAGPGTCRTSQGALTKLLGSTTYSIPYTAIGINDQRPVVLGGVPRIAPTPDNSIYAVTSYVEPADSSIVWSTCAYAPMNIVQPTTTTIFSPVCSPTPPPLPGPGMYMPVPFPQCWIFQPMIMPPPPTVPDPGWGAGVTSARQGLWSATVKNCDGSTSVTVNNTNRRFAFFARVNGVAKSVAPLGKSTFEVPAGGDIVVFWANTGSGPWDPISGNPLTNTSTCPVVVTEPPTTTTTTTEAPTTTTTPPTTTTTTTAPVASTTSTVAPVAGPVLVTNRPAGDGWVPPVTVPPVPVVTTTVAPRPRADSWVPQVTIEATGPAADVVSTVAPLPVLAPASADPNSDVLSDSVTAEELALTGQSTDWLTALGVALMFSGLGIVLVGKRIRSSK